MASASENISEANLLTSYTGKTVLVTGGAGFIGSTMVSALSQVSCRVVLLLRPGKSLKPIDCEKAEIIALHGNINNQEFWSTALAGVDYVFHFAAQTSAYVADKDPEADMEANVTPLVRLLGACRTGGVRPAIMFAGTATQAGLPKANPVNETAIDDPITAYDVNKLAGEKLLRAYTNETGVPTATLRLANVYGSGTNVGSGDRGFLNLIVKNALDGKPLTVYGDGEYIRDYIFVDDVVSAFLRAGHCVDGLAGGYYVIGSGKGTRIVDAVNMVADRVGTLRGERGEVIHVPVPKSLSSIETRDFIADSSLFQSATGWTPKVYLIEGIDRTIQYFVGKFS